MTRVDQEETMRFANTVISGALALGAFWGIASAQSPDVKVAMVVELSGAGATTGTNWRDGVNLAVAEINAKGGILGRKIALTSYDTQTNPGVSRAQVQKALDDDPYVVLGPIYSGSVKVDMALTEAANVPQLVGAQAPDITAADNPYIFRTTFNSADIMPKLADYMKSTGARTFGIIWVNNDFGKGGRDAFVKEAAARGMTMVMDQPAELGQVDFAPEVNKIKRSAPELLFVYVNEEEAARFLIEARRSNIQSKLIGATTLLNDKVIELAGGAADGVEGFLELSAKAPLPEFQAFVGRFTARYNRTPDHAAAAGYLAVYAVKYTTEKIGKFDREAFAKTLHGLTIRPSEEPGILMETTWQPNGDIARGAFIAEIHNGKQVIKTVLPK